MSAPHDKQRLTRAVGLPSKAQLDERARLKRELEWHGIRTEAYWQGLRRAKGIDPLEAAKTDYVEGRIDHETFETRVGRILQ